MRKIGWLLILAIPLTFFLRVGKPLSDNSQIEEGESLIWMEQWFRHVAAEHYGDASYWKELELINRRPDGRLLIPGKEIVVPTFRIIKEIREWNRRSATNSWGKPAEVVFVKACAARMNFINETEEVALPPIAFDSHYTIVQRPHTRNPSVMAGLTASGLFLLAALFSVIRARRVERPEGEGINCSN